ncbi:hypothetical protein BH24ACT24_BH24ACT24_01910 [soil metagenome]
MHESAAKTTGTGCQLALQSVERVGASLNRLCTASDRDCAHRGSGASRAKRQPLEAITTGSPRDWASTTRSGRRSWSSVPHRVVDALARFARGPYGRPERPKRSRARARRRAVTHQPGQARRHRGRPDGMRLRARPLRRLRRHRRSPALLVARTCVLRAKQQSMERGFGAIAPRRERSSARRVSSLLLLVRCGRLRHTGGHARIRQVAGARRRRCPVWRWRTGRREARAGRAARCPVASPSGTRALAAEHRTELVGGAWRRARRRWGAVSGYGRVLRLLNIPGGDGHAGGASGVHSRDHRG